MSAAAAADARTEARERAGTAPNARNPHQAAAATNAVEERPRASRATHESAKEDAAADMTGSGGNGARV